MRHFSLALAFTLLAACQKPAEPPPPPRPALVIKAGANASDVAMALIGEVRPRYESAQGFRIAGKIISRNVEIGSMVKRGQVLARLDASDTGLNAEAAQADVRVAEADLALAQAELDRQRQLYAQKFISASALDNREAQFKSANARAQQVRAQAAVSGNQSRYATLSADRDGVVTDIHAEPGQVVQAGEVIARIADPRQLEVVIAVPESRMTGVKQGEKAEVRMWANRDKTYEARVREIAPAADAATRTFQVKVSILDADQAVRLGMTAGVSLADEIGDALLLPTSAVTQRDGKPVIWLVDPKNNSVQPHPVTIAQFREDGVLVTGGLDAGELVVVAGVHTLIPGQVVAPRQAGAQ
jgi:multidrug efflux system membrane fusion protein